MCKELERINKFWAKKGYKLWNITISTYTDVKMHSDLKIYMWIEDYSELEISYTDIKEFEENFGFQFSKIEIKYMELILHFRRND